jgi:hypothetical protein
MNFYLTNITGSEIDIEDVDVQIAAGQTLDVWNLISAAVLAKSRDMIPYIVNKQLIGNNGNKTLDPAETLSYAQNPQPLSADGKALVRADSRPIGTTTYFTSRGDSAGIGDGNNMWWSFADTDDDIASPPAGWKGKEIDLTFADEVWLKEGTIYFHNALPKSYVHLMILCPDQGFYLDRDGAVQQASGDVLINRYVNHHHICGDCPMGDELNTEGSSNAIPAGYIFRTAIYVPDTDSASHGNIEMELYRKRTYLLPGESL